jgi:hypothetical protein
MVCEVSVNKPNTMLYVNVDIFKDFRGYPQQHDTQYCCEGWGYCGCTVETAGMTCFQACPGCWGSDLVVNLALSPPQTRPAHPGTAACCLPPLR